MMKVELVLTDEEYVSAAERVGTPGVADLLVRCLRSAPGSPIRLDAKAEEQDFPDPLAVVGTFLAKARRVLAEAPEPIPAWEFPSIAALLPELDEALEAVRRLDG